MSQYDLTNIIKVLELRSAEKLNSYLDIGWVLIGTSSDQHSANGYYLSYSIGWSKKLGEVKFPEKTKSEIELENWANNSPST
ncbi:hypothetical protein [Aeromonas caviae]|uniref:hypothetical protein n=1 Tax=Aeromonas caviae TaxID=648 RepID=UPI0038D1C3C0